MLKPIDNRYEFVILFDCENGNPNGDPDDAGRPRVDPDTGHGLVKDTCLKYKIRRYVEALKEGEPGFQIYMRNGAPLEDTEKKALTYVGLDLDALKNSKADPAIDFKIRQYMCENYWDIRTFGGVLTTFVQGSLNCGQITGTCQLSIARSIDPVQLMEVQLSRDAITKAEDYATKKTEFGRQTIIPYALYRAEGYIQANLARKSTGFSEEDLEVLWTAILNMFELDRSVMRGKMAVQELIIFKHDSVLGNAQAHKLFRRVKVSRKDGVVHPRSYSDYNVEVDLSDMPKGVQCIRKD